MQRVVCSNQFVQKRFVTLIFEASVVLAECSAPCIALRSIREASVIFAEEADEKRSPRSLKPHFLYLFLKQNSISYF